MAEPELLAKWIDWRCRTVADFYRRLAAKVAAVRPDIKFVVNSFLLPDICHPDFGKEDFIVEANRRAGLDVRLLEGVPNLTVAQTEIPADYRWFGPIPGRWKRAADPAAASAAHRLLYAKRGDFANVKNAAHPWVNVHDRYFENACGAVSGKRAKGKKTLATDWFSEHSWRVSTLNPSGRHALMMFAVPLYHNDVMTFSKGGYLIGQSYFYAVNTDARPRSLACELPAGTVDLVSGEVSAGKVRLELKPYELRAYRAPAGVPR